MSAPSVNDITRVAVVQYAQERAASFADFLARVTAWVEAAADYRCDFLVFPEFLLLQTLSSHGRRLAPAEAVDALTELTPAFSEAMRALAVRHQVNIVGGAHPCRQADGRVRNTAFVFLRDGRVVTRAKIHATPSESACWGVRGGDDADVIDTDRGKVGILVCYDSEFPELARRLVDQGAQLLLVPFCTDDRHGYLRVRYCCQARAVENQVYVALAGNVGLLPDVANMDIQYAQSMILTPCDTPFARDGIAAQASENVPMLIFADLSAQVLVNARTGGTVRNLADRRGDLYAVRWKGDGG